MDKIPQMRWCMILWIANRPTGVGLLFLRRLGKRFVMWDDVLQNEVGLKKKSCAVWTKNAILVNLALV